MKLKQPHHISFDNFEDILKNHVDSSSQPPYTGRTFAMVKNVIPALKKSGFANNLLQFSDIRLGCIKEGEIEGIINLRHYHLTKGNIVCLTPNTILELTKVSPNFNLMGLTLNSEQLAIWHKESLPTFLINQMSEIVLKPNSEDLEIFFQLFNLLWNTAHRYGDDCKMVPDLMSCIFHHVQYIISTYSKDNNRTEKREKKIFQTIILLVNQSNGIKRKLSYYASCMNLTQRYLGTVVKQVSGITAKEWIDRSTIQRIKVMLRHSDKQIAQISYELGFPNESFFSKYFKRITGTTPKTYRDESV